MNLLHFMKKCDITHMQGTPSRFGYMLEGWPVDFMKNLVILSSGEPLLENLAVKLQQRSKSLWNMYAFGLQ